MATGTTAPGCLSNSNIMQKEIVSNDQRKERKKSTYIQYSYGLNAFYSDTVCNRVTDTQNLLTVILLIEPKEYKNYKKKTVQNCSKIVQVRDNIEFLSRYDFQFERSNIRFH